jgi:pyruvate formate lyase activating enzyme
MPTCQICHQSAQTISRTLGVCLNCIREKPTQALKISNEIHAKIRADFGLPPVPPDDPQGVACTICVNQCQIPERAIGYCGLRTNRKGKLVGVSATQAKLIWYHDPLPTNCVGDWVCAGGTGAGYPQYAYCPQAEYGYKNLAVFFEACSFNCLFCQNWHFREKSIKSNVRSVETLVDDVDEHTSCICYFGGDPSPQLPFSLKAARQALELIKDRILRICWETNGSMRPDLLDDMMELALDSGGCVKFDLKASDLNLHRALTGITNKRTLENFVRAAKSIHRRHDPPLLIANSLLVPGYIDEHEIGAIAKFIADLDSDIPYSLLAFHPQFYMSDLPVTSKAHAERCYQVARDAGLRRVRIGNVHLLS